MERRVARIWKRGSFFERVRKLQTTLIRIFIILESESHGLSKTWDGISRKTRKFKRFFSPKPGDIQKKKKVSTEIEPDFSAKIGNSNAFSGQITTSTWQLRHPIFFGGGAVFIFSPKIGLKSTKNVRFCILYRPMGGGGSSLFLAADSVKFGWCKKVAGILNIALCYFVIKRKTVRTPHSFLIDDTWLFW